MSLKSQTIEPIPEETTIIAKAAFPKGNTMMKIRDELAYYMKMNNSLISSPCVDNLH